MVIIKIQKNTACVTTDIGNEKIRRQFDQKTSTWYFSVVDVIGVLTNTSDPRNYWKVLKNRLSKRDNQLVTRCNQLKMRSNDGKYYLTDTADAATMIEIIESMPKATVEVFKILIADLEAATMNDASLPSMTGQSLKVGLSTRHNSTQDIPETNLHHSLQQNNGSIDSEVHHSSEAKLLLDASENSDSFTITAMIAGVDLADLSVVVTSHKVFISGKRVQQKESANEYIFEELFWVKFSRIINLPSPVRIDTLEKYFDRGVLTILLKKL